MKSILMLLAMCFVSISANRLGRRGLLEEKGCPNYNGPELSREDLQIEVTYLSAVPSEEQLDAYGGLLELPTGTLFGRASVHFSFPFPEGADLKYFKISKLPGELIGLEMIGNGCDITLDFLIYSTCQDTCIPAGACLELDNELLNEETGHELPFREGCKALDINERLRCMDASVRAMGMGFSEEDGKAYTDEEHAHLMILFSSPFSSYIDFVPEDFNITGPEGTYIEAVEATMPDNPMNIAYTITIRHGSDSTDDKEIKICFVGADTIRATGTPYDSEKTVCSTYIKSTQKPEFLMPSIEIRKSRAPVVLC